MSETKPSQAAARPEEKPTVAMPPPPAWAIDVMSNVGDLKKVIADGFQAVDSRLTTIEGNQMLQGGQVLDIGRRMTEVERRVGGIEERQNTDSLRRREPSQHDIEAMTEIASEKLARERLEKKVDDLLARPDATDRFLEAAREVATEAAKRPAVQKLGTAFVGLLLVGIMALTAKLQSQVTHLETKPETVQPAPTVYVPVPTPMAVIADGGAK